MKKALSNHLSEKWILYLVSCILLVLLSSWGIKLTGEPNKKEKVSIFAVTNSKDTNDLYDKLNNSLDEDGYLKKVEINAYTTSDEYLYVYVQVYYSECDILILPTSIIEQYGCPAALDFTDVIVDGINNESSEYYVDSYDRKLGLKIHSKGETDDYFSKYFTFSSTNENNEVVDEDYYLFIKKESLHMGSYTSASLDGGLDVLKELFKDEN